jgi:hypothetical protein
VKNDIYDWINDLGKWKVLFGEEINDMTSSKRKSTPLNSILKRIFNWDHCLHSKKRRQWFLGLKPSCYETLLSKLREIRV